MARVRNRIHHYNVIANGSKQGTLLWHSNVEDHDDDDGNSPFTKTRRFVVSDRGQDSTERDRMTTSRDNAALYHQQWLLQCFGWASRLRCLSVVIAANWPRKREEDNWTWASVKRKETRATRKQGCSDASLLRCAAPDWPSESAFLHAKIPAARFRHPHPLLNTLPSRTISLSIRFPSLSFFASLSNTARTKPTRLLRLRAKSPKPRWLRDRPAFRFAWACLWVEPVIRWRGRASLYRSANVPTP